MLKTNNYLDKNYNEIKSVVAIAQINTNDNIVIMKIGLSREAIEANRVIESKFYSIKYDRNGDLFAQAYEAVKAPRVYTKADEITGEIIEVTEPSFFSDWEDEFPTIE